MNLVNIEVFCLFILLCIQSYYLHYLSSYWYNSTNNIQLNCSSLLAFAPQLVYITPSIEENVSIQVFYFNQLIHQTKQWKKRKQFFEKILSQNQTPMMAIIGGFWFLFFITVSGRVNLPIMASFVVSTTSNSPLLLLYIGFLVKYPKTNVKSYVIEINYDYLSYPQLDVDLKLSGLIF